MIPIIIHKYPMIPIMIIPSVRLPTTPPTPLQKNMDPMIQATCFDAGLRRDAEDLGWVLLPWVGHQIMS